MTVDPSSEIHASAVVEPGAKIGPGCKIGPYSVIGPDVHLVRDVDVKAHVVLDGLTTIGADTTIFSFASIGVEPQNVRYRGERTRLVIGDRNRIFQYATICVGTVDGGGVTEIGNDCMLMIGAHVAHDCKVGDHVVMVNYAAIAGHCTVGDHVTIGAQAGVHQRCRIGEGAMVGGHAAVARDVIPYGTVYGERATLRGLNIVGLRRRGIEPSEVRKFQSAFQAIFRNSGNIRDSAKEFMDHADSNDQIREMVEFILDGGTRNLCTPGPIDDPEE